MQGTSTCCVGKGQSNRGTEGRGRPAESGAMPGRAQLAHTNAVTVMAAGEEPFGCLASGNVDEETVKATLSWTHSTRASRKD